MKQFSLSIHCTSKLHCKTCRLKENGRNWRQSIIDAGYSVPGDIVDFECPFDVPWSDESVNIQQKREDFERQRRTQSRTSRGCNCSRNTKNESRT